MTGWSPGGGVALVRDAGLLDLSGPGRSGWPDEEVGLAVMSGISTVLADRYRLDERIAAGSVGEVWRGADVRLNRPVAVKLLRAEFARHPETLARFRAEARHAGSLSHPAIAQIYDYVEADPPYLVMELVGGSSLAVLLARGPMAPARAMEVIAQAADGLGAAHAAGLVHHDVKPANLLVGQDGQVKITDFGIAHVAGSAPPARPGTVFGTPAYLAPERVAGTAAAPAADLYSLGVVAYECLAGAPPFSGEPLEVASAHRDRAMPPLPAAVPTAVAGFVAELTARDPAQRPATARQVALRARQLKDALADPPGVPADHRAEPAFATVAYTGYGTLTDMDMAGWVPEHPQRRGKAWPGRAVAIAVVVTALTAGLVGWVGGSLAGTTQPPRQAVQPPAAARSAPLMAEVNGSALIGQPVRQVRRELVQLGLHVSILWQAAGQQPGGQQPGTVASVHPGGQVAVGSTIYLTATPPQSDHGRGNGPGADGGGGDGGGGGGDGGGGN
jgi:hypothetical protein